jgi:hypothetical protein
MVWGAFYGAGELLRLGRDPDGARGGYTAASYVGVLDEELPRIWKPDLLFMQDNAPIHTSRLAREWLAEQGITVLEWPPYSPNLNPIEHVWFRLKKHVYEVRPDIESVGGSDERIQQLLYEALERAWAMLPPGYMESLVRGMYRRTFLFSFQLVGSIPKQPPIEF